MACTRAVNTNCQRIYAHGDAFYATYAFLTDSCQSIASGIAVRSPWAGFPGLVPGAASGRSLPPFAYGQHSEMPQLPIPFISHVFQRYLIGTREAVDAKLVKPGLLRK